MSMNNQVTVVVYRESQPYPIRHITTCRNYTGEKDYMAWYESVFRTYGDEVIKICGTADEAVRFVEGLAAKSKLKTENTDER